MWKDLEFAWGILRRRPFDCLLQVTNRCNMKCSFCDFWPNPAPRGEELTLGDYRRLARELSGMGRFLVSVEGGEPFVRPDLIEIVGGFSEHLTALFTNGWYVTSDNARALYDAGLSLCSVSIDYPQFERHDAKRRLQGASERAWRAVDHLLEAAPRGSRQVNVITVIMEDNWRDLEALLQMSAARGVGHQLTLLSNTGYRRGRVDQLPSGKVSAFLLDHYKRYPHLRFFRKYLAQVDTFLEGGRMPTCRAGVQSFNIDHVGNVSPCIEKIDQVYGNVKTEPLARIHERLVADREEVSRCQSCWTACRGLAQSMGQGGSLDTWWDLATRMRSS
jgi:MoaA/NifB/PqqE/SkfB family radical SAM enzyme